MTDSETELVARVKQGDPAALAAYLESVQPQLLGFIEKRMSAGLKQKVEALDILQELSVSALNAAESFDFGDRDPFGWLCQQAERRIIDAHRRHFGAQKRSAHREVHLGGKAGGDDQPAGMAELVAASLTTPSAALSRKHKEFHMLAALESLPEESRIALRMRYVEGLPSKEIAEHLGKSDGAVRVLLTRSLQKLQEVLSHNTDFQTLLRGRPGDA